MSFIIFVFLSNLIIAVIFDASKNSCSFSVNVPQVLLSGKKLDFRKIYICEKINIGMLSLSSVFVYDIQKTGLFSKLRKVIQKVLRVLELLLPIYSYLRGHGHEPNTILTTSLRLMWAITYFIDAIIYILLKKSVRKLLKEKFGCFNTQRAMTGQQIRDTNM